MVALGSGGLAAPAGFAIMAHGFDHIQTGIRSILTNQHSPSLTSAIMNE